MASTIDKLRTDASGCQACPLWRHATQTVFGDGNPNARIMLIGEQPGDAEDIAGRPFVGPAGKLLDRALGDAGLPRDDLYVTNTVKHFKWEAHGRRRLHKTPVQAEIDACRRWLDAEMEAVRPQLLVCLGLTAARALLGGSPVLKNVRGHLIERPAGQALLVTVHPSYILRVPPNIHALVYQGMVSDLKLAAEFLNRPVPPRAEPA